MPKSKIGNNTYVGNNYVAVGIPARVIRNIDEYYESAKAKKEFCPTHGLLSEEKKAYFEKHIV